MLIKKRLKHGMHTKQLSVYLTLQYRTNVKLYITLGEGNSERVLKEQYQLNHPSRDL